MRAYHGINEISRPTHVDNYDANSYHKQTEATVRVPLEAAKSARLLCTQI